MQSPQLAAPQRTFLGHPVGLYVLFFTEMWERFSYYGMRGLLMLYMVNYFRWDQKNASEIYKLYTSFVYVTPIIGGYLADRYLGNKWAVIIGAILMAIGHFLMAFEATPIFYSALIFLIIGNGFFKPNMSTQVGRLYSADDGRRDGAYTIFYMGINLGAFLSPIACGWLAENTMGGYHSGFTLAGIGMVAGLLIYVFGLPLVREIDPSANSSEPSSTPGQSQQQGAGSAGQVQSQTQGKARVAPPGVALTEAQAAAEPSVLGGLSNLIPPVLMGLGVLVTLAAPVCWAINRMDQWNAVFLAIAGGCLVLIGFVAGQVQGGMRDRVSAILILGVFVMFFWGAFEQAGNVLNIWADKHTDRYMTKEQPAPKVIPEVKEDEEKKDEEEPVQPTLVERFTTMFVLKPSKNPDRTWGEWFEGFINPLPTTWFQSINALAIFVIAPIFAWLWVYLDRRGYQPSIPMKMVFGLVFMAASVFIMVGAANKENQQTIAKLEASQLPEGVILIDGDKLGHEVKGEKHAFNAGRLVYDEKKKSFSMYGVLPDTEAEKIIGATVPKAYAEALEKLKEDSQDIDGKEVKSASVTLKTLPPGFDMRYAGLKTTVVRFSARTKTLTAYAKLQDKEIKALKVAGGSPEFRKTVHQLHIESNTFTVSSLWLFWSYILATLGELCLSPVGLSMVSKLAPAKFATMLMGVWMLTSAFGNYAAGALGEIWGTIPPTTFFWQITAVVGVAAIVLLALSRLVVATMHGVK